MNEDEIIFTLMRRELASLLGDPLPQGSFSRPCLEQIFLLPQHFLRRGEAETNSAFKQIIPYQLFYQHNRFFVYQRGSDVGEGRLAGRLSLGIGGHINSNDADNKLLTSNSYETALLRERQEELNCPNDLKTQFIGWINDESDPVGQVHLGVVHLCQVSDPEAIKIRKNDEDIHEQGWWSAAEIMAQKEKFEKWSLLALELAS